MLQNPKKVQFGEAPLFASEVKFNIFNFFFFKVDFSLWGNSATTHWPILYCTRYFHYKSTVRCYNCVNINKCKQKICVCHLFIIKVIYHKDASWRQIIFFSEKYKCNIKIDSTLWQIAFIIYYKVIAKFLSSLAIQKTMELLKNRILPKNNNYGML